MHNGQKTKSPELTVNG